MKKYTTVFSFLSIKNLGAFKANFLLVTTFLFLVWFFLFLGRANALEFENIPEKKYACKYNYFSNKIAPKSSSGEEITLIEMEDGIKFEIADTKELNIKKSEIDLNLLFEKYANEYGVSSDILEKIAGCESGFNPNAKNGIYGGLFQFSSQTWSSNRRAMGLDTDPNLRFDSEEAIRTAAFKISRDGTGAWPVCQNR